MKTLVFNGSPRPDGDTVRLICELVGGLPGDYKIVDVCRAGLSHCTDCRYCKSHDGCAIDDGMDEIYADIKECDAIVVASPVHFSELSGPLMSAMGRLQALYCARRFRGVEPIVKPKRGGILLAAGGDGSPERAAETAKMLLAAMGAREILPAVVCSPTDARPAADDAAALHSARALAKWLAGEPAAPKPLARQIRGRVADRRARAKARHSPGGRRRSRRGQPLSPKSVGLHRHGAARAAG